MQIRFYVSFLTCLWGIFLPAQPLSQQDSSHFEQIIEDISALNEAAEFEEALVLSRSLVQQAAHFPTSRYYLLAQSYQATIHADLGQGDSAHALITRVLAQLPLAATTDTSLQTEVLQSAGIIQYKRAAYPLAQQMIRKELDLLLAQQDSFSPEVANAYQNLAVIQTELGHLDSSIYYNQLALPIQEAYQDSQPDMYATLLGNIGLDYGLRGDYHEAEVYITRALDLNRALYGADHPDLGIAYHNLAYLAARNSDYHRALDYYDNALRIYQLRLHPHHPYILLTHTMRGEILMKLERYMTAKASFEKARDLSLAAPSPNPESLHQAYGRLGMVHYWLRQYDQAEIYLEKAIQILRSVQGADHITEGEYVGKLALNSLAQGQLVRAKTQALAALRILKAHYVAPHPDLVNAAAKVAECFAQMGQRDSALHYFAQGVQAASPAAPKAFLGRQPGIELASLFAQKAQYTHTWAQETQEGRWLDSAWAAVEASQGLIDTLRKQGLLRKSQLALGKWSQANLWPQGLDIAVARYRLSPRPARLEAALHIADQSKYGIMRDALQRAQIEATGQVPPALIDSLHEMDLDLRWDRAQLQEMAPGDSNFAQVQARYSRTLQREQSLSREIDAAYPQFAALRYQAPRWRLADIQAALAADQAILFYAEGQDSLYAFVIGPQTVQLRAWQKPPGLSQQVEKFRQGIYQYFTQSTPAPDTYAALADSFCTAGHQLYQQLIAPIQPMLPPRLVIIPAGVMGYIPFAALVQKPGLPVTAFDRHTYWGQQHALSYGFALGWWLQQQSIIRPASRKLLAMAPSFGPSLTSTMAAQRDQLGSLQFNQQEVKALARIWPTTIFTGSSASLPTFLAEGPQHDILHLATHAKAYAPGSGEAYCAFAGADTSARGGRLYLPDLYHLHLPAALVVLSACQTGIGPLEAGEGIASLAGGFAEAGAARVLTTLWSVQDQQTAALMPAFYTRLWADIAADEALAEVQRAHVAQVDAYLAHPFFWAGFSLYGSSRPIERPARSWHWLLISLLIGGLVGIGGWNLRRHKRARPPQ